MVRYNTYFFFQLQDSFSKSSSSGTAPTANNSSGHVPNLNSHATNVAPGGGSGSGSGGNNFNKNPGQSDNQGLSGYSTYNNYNKQASGGGYGNSYQQYQQYPNSNSFSSQQQQQQGSAGQSAGSSSQYKGVGQYDKYDPSLSNPATSTGRSSVDQHHSVQQQHQQMALNLAATNAFAAQQMPPGYAYYFGNMGNMSLQGYPQTPQGHVYQPQAMGVPGAGTTPSQFQKQTYGTR